MLNVDEQLKKDFSAFAKWLGTNPSNLMRMFMADTIKTKKVTFGMGSPFSGVEIEPLDTSNFSDHFHRKTDEYTWELRMLLANNRKIWK